MTDIARRHFLQGLSASPLAFWLAGDAQANTTRIRHDLTTAEGGAMLRVFADTMRNMQGKGGRNPSSWVWQWYTHFVNGTTTKAAELDRIFGTTPSAVRTLAEETWNTCQSHAGQNANHFLPWHRMFVYFFENIVRNLSGRADFAMPYWDYSSTDPLQRGVVPLAFRLPGDPVFGVLYRSDRSPLAASGQPIHTGQVGDPLDLSAVMAKPNYSTVGAVRGFCRSLDDGVHGSIHVLVGNRTNMGAVPYAARDPLFWVHHSNIDRLWASWVRNGGVTPAAAWSTTQFIFAAPGGQRITGQLKDYFSLEPLGYTYDRWEPPPLPTPAMSAQRLSVRAGRAERVARADGSVELGPRPVRVALRRDTSVPGAVSRTLGTDPSRPAARAWLVVKDLHAWAQPGVLYDVHVGPAGGLARLDASSLAGKINFFDAEFHDHGNADADTALGENFFSFDITGQLRALDAGGADLRDVISVVFAPAGRPHGDARPLVGTIELVRQ